MIPTRTTLTAAQEDLLGPLLDEATRDPAALARLSARAARTVGRGPGPGGGRIEDEARVRLLIAVATTVGDRDAVAQAVADLYAGGDDGERRAVLLALASLDLGDRGVPVVLDALRTNDVRIVAAAMGPYAAAHLDDDSWRHGVLKCLFTGVPTAAVADLERRRDAELERMVRAYADERAAAGRAVPDDARALLAAH